MSAKDPALPPTWALAALGDLGSWFGGGTPRKANSAYWAGNVPWVSPKDMKVPVIHDAADRITEQAIEESATRKISAPAVLVVTRSGILAHTLPVATTAVPVAINQDLKALEPATGINAGYVAFALRSLEQRILRSCKKDGTTVASLETDSLLDVALPIAPSREQARIVDDIELQLSRIDAAVTSLERIESELARYRASILKAACEGRLVATEAELARAEGREYEPAGSLLERILAERRVRSQALGVQKPGQGREGRRPRQVIYREPDLPTISALPQLPDGWTWARWTQIAFSQNGRAFPSSDYRADGIRLLRPGNLHRDGRVEWTPTNTRCLSPRWAEEFPEFVVGPGELVMNLTAQSLKDEFLGRVCITGPGDRCLLNQRIARLTPILVEPRYLLWMLRSPLFRSFVDELNTGSLIQHMFTSQLDEFCFPVPPLAEQRRIAAEVERRLSIADEIAATVDAALAHTARLRQSILKRAFEGKLVPQDPDDEPASVLLERIRKEREAVANQAQRRSRPRAPRKRASKAARS